ncbi:MAG: hypothetical protein ACE5WD_14030 [Candidatus Aminicenantia bacterium]
MRDLEKIRREVKLIRDELGMPVDEAIKELVIGLHCCGIKTLSSCGGHLDRGLPYPWVRVPYEFAEKLARVVAWQNRPRLPDGSSNKNTWVIKPKANLTLMPEDKSLSLKQLQRYATEFGLFLQLLPEDRFPKGWFKK